MNYWKEKYWGVPYTIVQFDDGEEHNVAGFNVGLLKKLLLGE